MIEPGHILTARALVGRPFQHLGRGPGFFDCLGLLVVSCAANGLLLRDRAVYGRHAKADGLRAELFAQFGPPVPGQPQVGDLGAFRFEGDWHHVGLFGAYPSGGLSLIHTYAEVGKVVEQPFEGSQWRGRLAGVFRHPAWRTA